jgi:ABC-type nitrate/sulfonate/bicarbonate transport system substrate-binding protein
MMQRGSPTRIGPALVAGITVVVAAACAVGPGDSRPAPIRVAFANVPDFDDLAALVAHDRLEAEGYAIEYVPFAVSELGAEALARGDVQFANGAVRSYWSAVARGAPIVTLMEHVVDVHRLVATSEIDACDDLDGRQVGIQSAGAAGTALLRAYLDATCPDARPELLYIPQSENRTVALTSGGLDASVLELSDTLWIQAEHPGRFHVLADFQALWPEVPATGVHVNAAYAAAHPEVVLAYIRARLVANRAVAADPTLVVARADRAIGPSPAWPAIAEAYVAANAWHARGRLTPAGVAEALGLFGRYGGLSGRLTAAQVADLTYLDAALAELDGEVADR